MQFWYLNVNIDVHEGIYGTVDTAPHHHYYLFLIFIRKRYQGEGDTF